jgi:tRNA-dihydrouridine synthase 2
VAAAKLLQNDVSGIDVNMGCPMKFSTSGGMGAALMKDPENARSIMSALHTSFGHKLSISCKIRMLSTFDATLSFIENLQSYINWISVHPRTQSEKSQVPAKWFIVKQLIESGKVKVPIYGSGDMFSTNDIVHFLRFTKA